MRKVLLLTMFSIWAFSAQYGGTVVFGRAADSSTMDPAHGTDSETFYATTQVYDNLVQFKIGSTELEPGLASSWDISKDGLEYTFHLRKGVYFAPTKYFKKKVELTADDVVFSMKRQFDETNPYNSVGGAYEYWSAMDMNNIVKDVVKVDKYTVKFILKKPEASFLANMAMDFASILCKEYADDLLSKKKAEDLGRYPVGTGPFVFVRWLKDDKIVYVANKDHWNKAPYIKNLIIKVIPNVAVRAAELKTGSITILDYPNAQTVEDLSKDKSIKIAKRVGLNTYYLAMNEKRKVFQDKRVRQAVSHAINKKAIVKAMYGDTAVVAENILPPTVWSYNKKIKTYPYNPQKAKQLLKEAGYPNGFEIELYARGGVPHGRKMAEAIQADLAKVGIKVKIIVLDWVTYLQKAKQGECDMAIMGWTGDNGDPDNFLFINLSAKAAQVPAQNFSFWINKEFNELIEKAKVISDVKERTKLYKKAQETFAEDAPIVPMAHNFDVFPMSSKLQDYVVESVGKRRFLRVWIKK